MPGVAVASLREGFNRCGRINDAGLVILLLITHDISPAS